MKLVVIESPYAGDVAGNLAYLDLCLLDCLRRGESPYASHLMLTGVLDDADQDQRALGIGAGYAWHRAADRVVFYTDCGWSRGMLSALDLCQRMGTTYEIRQLATDFA